jgi:hypothetical protein
MIIKEHNKINNKEVIRITSDKENYFVKIKGTTNEPTNEIIIETTQSGLEFEEIYVEPKDNFEEVNDTANE